MIDTKPDQNSYEDKLDPRSSERWQQLISLLQNAIDAEKRVSENVKSASQTASERNKNSTSLTSGERRELHKREAAVSALHNHVLRISSSFYSQRGIDYETARDLAAEVLLRFWKLTDGSIGADKYQHLRAPGAYLYRIQQLVLLEYLRSKRSPVHEVPLNAPQEDRNESEKLVDPGPSPEALALSTIAGKQIFLRLQKELTPEQMKLIRLLASGMSVHEVAQHLNTERNTIDQRLLRARKRAQKILDEIKNPPP